MSIKEIDKEISKCKEELVNGECEECHCKDRVFVNAMKDVDLINNNTKLREGYYEIISSLML